MILLIVLLSCIIIWKKIKIPNLIVFHRMMVRIIRLIKLIKLLEVKKLMISKKLDGVVVKWWRSNWIFSKWNNKTDDRNNRNMNTLRINSIKSKMTSINGLKNKSKNINQKIEIIIKMLIMIKINKSFWAWIKWVCFDVLIYFVYKFTFQLLYI